MNKRITDETIGLLAHVIRWATVVQEELSVDNDPIDLGVIIVKVVGENAGKNQGEVVKATTEYLLSLGHDVPPYRVYNEIRGMLATGKLYSLRGRNNAVFLSVPD